MVPPPPVVGLTTVLPPPPVVGLTTVPPMVVEATVGTVVAEGGAVGRGVGDAGSDGGIVIACVGVMEVG